MIYETVKTNSIATCLSGFTLIEVVASMAILAILLSSVFVVYERTSDNVITETLQQRALAVAQRQMEILIATRQEPDSEEAGGWDEFDPMFQWHLTLQRESFGSSPPKPDLSNTVIKAIVTVEWDDLSELPYDLEEPNDYGEDGQGRENFEGDWEQDWGRDEVDRDRTWSNRSGEASNKMDLVRYFENEGFKPIPGQSVAVPMTRETPPSPQWYLDLVDRLGRDPTPQEVIGELLKQGTIPQEMIDGLGYDENKKTDDGESGPMSPEDILDLNLKNLNPNN